MKRVNGLERDILSAVSTFTVCFFKQNFVAW